MANTALVPAIGHFRAKTVNDAEARSRDGRPYYAIRWLPSVHGERIAEIQFADGMWMLVGPSDLMANDGSGLPNEE